MSREIIEAVRTIEQEKGIESETLVRALEDALLAAYKKTPGAARHATVELDDEGEFRVYSIEIPTDLEARLLDQAREAKLQELEALEQETGERSHTLVSDDDLELDWSEVPDEQIKRDDVTPENFGRIAAQRPLNSSAPSSAPAPAKAASASARANSESDWMSTFQPVRRAARRAFSPSLPIASASWSSGTITVASRVSSSTNTSRTRAGESALATKRAGSVFHGMMSIFSPRSSDTTMRTREPRGPTQAPTGSTPWTCDSTAIFER